MSGFGRYFVTGWSPRFGHWVTETYECATMALAKSRFMNDNPTLKQVRVYALRD